MTDYHLIEYIKDEMLKSSLPEKLVYNITYLAHDLNTEAYELMNQWMKNVDEVEKKLISERMMKVLDKYNRVY